MIVLFEYITGLIVVAVNFVLRVLPVHVSENVFERFEEAANGFHRLRLLRKHHPELVQQSRQIPVRCLAEGSFKSKHRRDAYDSRGLLLFADDAVKYWDLGQSTRLDPYDYQPGDATARLHTAEPSRQGERVWVELEGNGSTRYVQYDVAQHANEKTRGLFDEIRTVLKEPESKPRRGRRRAMRRA